MNILNKLNGLVWGTPTLLLIFFTGVVLSIRTGFFQIRFLGISFKAFFKKQGTSSGAKMTAMQSASTALSATMGTGNIIGVAGAITLGGPGAVFWMWVSAPFCMMIKFSEIALAVRYREQNRDGSYVGGAMYYIKNALPHYLSPLSFIFCACGVVAAFGMGNMAQINTMSTSVSVLAKSVADISPRADFLIKLLVGALCAACCAVVLKNDGNIGRFCEKTIPLMTILYIVMTTGAIITNYNNVPLAFAQIFNGAFSPSGVTGGVVGSAFIGLRFGMSRGVFSNEAGLGTAPIAYACGEGDETSLGLMGIMEVFIDTIVVCTLTALTILCVGNVSYGTDAAAGTTLYALSSVYGKNVIFIFCPVVCIFAFSSVIGWGLYGIKFVTFLFGAKAKKYFLILFVLAMLPAAVFRADAVWVIAEILNGIMALPNITALLLLSGQVTDIALSIKRKRQ